jgi:hypothetical protein
VGGQAAAVRDPPRGANRRNAGCPMPADGPCSDRGAVAGRVVEDRLGRTENFTRLPTQPRSRAAAQPRKRNDAPDR